MNGLIKQFFSEDNGSASMIRLISFLTTVTPLVVWAYTSIVTKTMAPLTPELIGLVLGSQAVKAYQKSQETNEVAPK
jgi:hypothetical protein